jgi:hypothetical protein
VTRVTVGANGDEVGRRVNELTVELLRPFGLREFVVPLRSLILIAGAAKSDGWFPAHNSRSGS